jgi:hypothetical protein
VPFGLAWAAAFSAIGLVIFGIKTRTRRHPPEGRRSPPVTASPGRRLAWLAGGPVPDQGLEN